MSLLLLALCGCQLANTKAPPARSPGATRNAGAGVAKPLASAPVPETGSAVIRAVDGKPQRALKPSQKVGLEQGTVLEVSDKARVSPDGAHLIGLDGATLIGLDGATLIAAGGMNMTAGGGSNLIAAGGMNMTAGGGSNLIAAGGMNMTAGSGSNLIAAGGMNLIAAGGMNMVEQGGSNLIAAGGMNLVNGQVGAMMGEVRAPAGLLGKGAAYRLQSERLVPAAGVPVYVRDGAGRFVVGADGQPITTTTDAEGRFLFERYLAFRGLSYFVPLPGDEEGNLGISAFRPRDLASREKVSVDPLATLLSSWIDTTILATQTPDQRVQAVDRLTSQVADVAREVIKDKLGEDWAGAKGDWKPETLASEAERLKKESGPIQGALEAVRRVMTLAGVSSCNTDGVERTKLALQQPVLLAAAPDGSVFVAERYTGILRRYKPDGSVSNLLGPCSPTERRWGSKYLSDLAVVGNQLYAADLLSNAVLRLSFDGQEVVELPAIAELTRDFRPTRDLPRVLAASRDGTLLVGLPDEAKRRSPRLLRYDPATNKTTAEAVPWPGTSSFYFRCLDEAPDGALWAVGSDGVLWLRRAAGEPWEGVYRVAASWPCGLLALPDGNALISDGSSDGVGPQRLRLVTRKGQVSVFAGADTAGLDRETVLIEKARFKLPAGLARLGETILVADSQNGLVRAIEGGKVSIWAGSLAPPGKSLAVESVLNLPGGIAVDSSGRIVLTEIGGNTVRRLENGQLSLIAGGEVAAVDPTSAEPPTSERLDGPTSVAAYGDDVFICEAYGRRLRKRTPDGRLTVLTGAGNTELKAPPAEGIPLLASQVKFADLLSVTVDRQGRPVFSAGSTSIERAQIWRIEPDGTLTWLAGSFTGSWPNPLQTLAGDPRNGKQARDVALSRLAGLAYDKDGNLFLAEPASARVWRIDPAGVITHYAGSGLLATLGKVRDGSAETESDVAATAASLLLPVGLACDSEGRLYIGEVGTRAAEGAAQMGGNTDVLADVPVIEGRVRLITRDGRAHILAGVGSGLQRDSVRNPMGVAVSPDGRLYVVDNGTSQLKEVIVTR
ncbi:MAG: hypothetical protein VKP62_11770 [Candidatus Sericytochromatia bacterium]|nr:hypothetical protein [Candidatus Sericytochromatia bacterium]